MTDLQALTGIHNIASLRLMVEKISSAIDTYETVEHNPANSGSALAKLSDAAEELLMEVQHPLKRLFLISHQGAQVAVMRAAIGTGLFDKFPATGDITLDELAKATNADAALLVRLLRVLSASYYVKETGVHRYTLTRHGKCLQVANYQSMIICGFDLHFLADAKIPEFLETTGWKNPADSSNTPFGFAYPGKSLFEYIGESPSLMKHFHATMGAIADFGLYNAVNEVPWVEIIGPVKSDEVSLIDLGGADGSLLMQILRRYPEIKGEFILQDLPEVIEKARKTLDKRVTPMEHDFFTEQPIAGARVYHLRMIFHDWPVEDCKKILRFLKPAMRPGYSKVLVTDAFLPDKGATLLQTSLDIAMMTISAEEKTEATFKHIFESEGFTVKKIWRSVQGVDCVIEAELDA